MSHIQLLAKLFFFRKYPKRLNLVLSLRQELFGSPNRALIGQIKKIKLAYNPSFLIIVFFFFPLKIKPKRGYIIALFIKIQNSLNISKIYDKLKFNCSLVKEVYCPCFISCTGFYRSQESTFLYRSWAVQFSCKKNQSLKNRLRSV